MCCASDKFINIHQTGVYSVPRVVANNTRMKKMLQTMNTELNVNITVLLYLNNL